MILDTKAKSRQKASGPSGPSTLIVCTIRESDTTVKTLHLEPVVHSNHSSFTYYIYYVNFKWILVTNSCPEVPLRHAVDMYLFRWRKIIKANSQLTILPKHWDAFAETPWSPGFSLCKAGSRRPVQCWNKEPPPLPKHLWNRTEWPRNPGG